MRVLAVGDPGEGLLAVLRERGHEVETQPGPDAAREALAVGPTPALLVVVARDAPGGAAAVRAVRSHVRGETAALLAVVPEAGIEAALEAGATFALPEGAGAPALRAAIASLERAAPRASPRDGPDHDVYFTRNPHPMWFFDVDSLAFVAVNDAAVAKYGWSREEFLRMTIRDIRPPEDLERLLAVTTHVARGLDRSPGWRHRAKDGRIFHVDILSYPMPLAGRACELVLAHDVSERVRAEAALEELRANMASSERLASIGTLAAGIAHEIGNPLTSLLANLSYAQAALGDAAGEAREALADAADGARRIQAITRDLMGFSRGGEDAIGRVDLERVVASALTLASPLLRPRARMTVDLLAAPPPRANEARLGQVLLNLLVNAAHAIPEGDPAQHEVAVRARGAGPSVVIDVSDTGPGVPEDIRARIFDPFFTTKPAGEGTGLGLWMCRRIVSELGGAISLVPSAAGATFRVVLPVA